MGDVFKNCIQYCRIVWYCEKGEKGKDLTRSFMMCSAQASVRHNSVLAVAAFIRAARPPIPSKLGRRSAFTLSFTLRAKEESEGEI